MTNKKLKAKLLVTPGWGRPEVDGVGVAGMTPEEAAELADLEATAPKPLPPLCSLPLDLLGTCPNKGHTVSPESRSWLSHKFKTKTPRLQERYPCDPDRIDPRGRRVGLRAYRLGGAPKRDFDAFLRRYDKHISKINREAYHPTRLCPMCWQRFPLLIDGTIPPHPDPRPRLKRSLTQECAGSGRAAVSRRRS